MTCQPSEGTEPADQKPEPDYAPTTPQAPDSRGVATSNDFANLSAKANWLISLLDTKALFAANPDIANVTTRQRLDVDVALAMAQVSELATIEGDEDGNLCIPSPSAARKDG